MGVKGSKNYNKGNVNNKGQRAKSANKQSKSHYKSDNKKIEAELSLLMFDKKYIIGKGGFGRVWKVALKRTNMYFALKEMAKLKIIDKKSEKLIKNERDLLAKINHPFIVNMHSAFQTDDFLYLVMDYLVGGDLRFHLSQQTRFTEKQAKFFICCLILGLEYLHVNNIIHRDIKPENLVLDSNGYLRITDFGIAKMYRKENGNETSGTPGYISPEVLKGINHTPAVDYFALGVLAYELMLGTRPYTGKNKRDLKEKVLTQQIKLTKKDIPNGWSIEVLDFINKLLCKQPANRLGLRSATEIKEHPWLRDYPWKELYYKTLTAPYIPEDIDNFDKKYCEGTDKVGNDTKGRYQQIALQLQNFNDYTFYRIESFGNYSNVIGTNMIEKEFFNPHPYLFQLREEEEEKKNNHLNIIKEIEEINSEGGGRKNAEVLESKFAKKKHQAFSLSNLTLMKEYKICCGNDSSSYSFQLPTNNDY